MIILVVVNFEIAAVCKALKCIRENSVMEISNFNKITFLLKKQQK